MLTFIAPAGTHVTDAKIWLWAEDQDIATIEDITCTDGVVRITPMLDLDARTCAELLTDFADNFGA